jgi:FMNH2-dependent dimethyl sulfone monooxygenase
VVIVKLGIWAPLPHTIGTEPEVERAVRDLATPGAGLPRDRSYTFVKEVVQRAEELGFDITLVAERLVAPDLEAWMVSAALAVETSRIEIMTAVHPGIFSPQLVAKMGASLDRLSGGRACINVVPGRRAHEFELFGDGWMDVTHGRYARIDEFIRVLKGLWSEEEFNFEGAFFPVVGGRLATKPLRRPYPPIYAASGAPEGMEIIARECDLWFATYEPGHARYEANVQRIAADAAFMKRRSAEHGRTIGVGVSTHVAIAATLEEAAEQARTIEADAQANVAAKALGAGLIGPPKIIAERIRRYQDIGVNCLMLQFHPMKEGLERFAQDVLPLIRRSEQARGNTSNAEIVP